MISVFTLPLAAVIIASVTILFLFSRLSAKLHRAELCRKQLEPFVRQKLDLICDTVEALANSGTITPPLSRLQTLSEAYRDEETGVMLAAYDRVAESLPSVREYFQGEVFTAPEEQLRQAICAYNEAAGAFNRSREAFPGRWITRLFLLSPEPLLIIKQTHD